MSNNLWVISDTHFGHANFLNFTDANGNRIRKFDSVEDMDEYMVTRWNETVRPNDKVYHLGDVFFGSPHRADKILARLHGRKRLLVGNHDDLDRTIARQNIGLDGKPTGDHTKVNVLREHFEKISLWRPFGKEGIIFSHIPLRKDQMTHDSKGFVLNVHGHIHDSVIAEPEYYNVSVEQIDYTPVHFDALVAIRTERMTSL